MSPFPLILTPLTLSPKSSGDHILEWTALESDAQIVVKIWDSEGLDRSAILCILQEMKELVLAMIARIGADVSSRTSRFPQFGFNPEDYR
jgi:hypothetical protein